MGADQREIWEKRLVRLKEEKRALGEKLAALQRENTELKKSIKNQTRLFDSNPNGIILIQDGKIVAINEIALSNYAADEVLGRNFLDLLHPDLKPFFGNLHRKRMSGKLAPEQYETEMILENGDTFPCEVWVKKIRFNGRKAFLFNTARAEQRKKKEKEIIHSKKREAIDTMAAGLTNRLEGCLKTIHAHIGRFPNAMPSGEKRPIEGHADVEDALKQTLRILENLASLSKMEKDRTAPQPFNLNEVCKEALSLAGFDRESGARAGGREIHLKTYLRAVTPAKGDPDEIRDAFFYAVQNAVEAMPKGGDLYLTTEEKADYAHIFIQDNGGGIPVNLMDRIFDPFFTTKGKAATGLGLSLASAIVQRNHGEIEITSREKQGTVCEIRLPIVKQADKLNATPNSRRLRGASILIMEQDDIVAELLRRFLGSKGYQIVRADNGSEGLTSLNKKKFDLVIVNPLITPFHGKGIVNEIRKRGGDIPIAVIGVTDKLETSGNRAAVDMIIDLPIDMNRVVKLVSEVLSQKTRSN